jgi:hypothetical protein
MIQRGDSLGGSQKMTKPTFPRLVEIPEGDYKVTFSDAQMVAIDRCVNVWERNQSYEVDSEIKGLRALIEDVRWVLRAESNPVLAVERVKRMLGDGPKGPDKAPEIA